LAFVLGNTEAMSDLLLPDGTDMMDAQLVPAFPLCC
jgi:hypothetical protein